LGTIILYVNDDVNYLYTHNLYAILILNQMTKYNFAFNALSRS